MGLLPVLASALALLSNPSASPKLVVVSWDGGADWVIDRLIREGRLPTLQKFIREGAVADSVIQAFPSKTAVGHMALFSGTWPSVNGVVGNSVPLLPKSEHALTETRSGFHGASHFVDPLWVTVAKGGLKALCLSAAGSYPPGPDQERLRAAGIPSERFVQFSGFEAGFFSGQVLNDGSRSQTIKVGDSILSVVAFDDPKDPTHGFDTVRIDAKSQGSDVRSILIKPSPASVKPRQWSPAIKVRSTQFVGHTFARLFDLNPTTGRMTLFVRGVNGMQGTQSSEENEAYQEAYGGFHDAGFGPYKEGLFGKPIHLGGDGTAEDRVLECIALDLEFTSRSFRYGLTRYGADVVFHYTQMSDDAGHCWMGLLDPSSGAYRKEVAERLWPKYARVFELQDAWLGDMMRAAGPRTNFALVSDHGMEGISRKFNVNVTLERAGLLTRTADGRIDYNKTKVCAPPWGDNQLVVNTVDRKGGIVPMEDKESVLKETEIALQFARDPMSGEKIVTRLFRPEKHPELGIGGVLGGDLYFDTRVDYYPSSRLEADVVSRIEDPRGDGVHGFWPVRDKMRAIFYLHGPGVARGVRVPPVFAIDVAPTLCALLGIPPGDRVQGTPIRKVLRDR